MTHCTVPIHYRFEVLECVGPYFSHQNLSSSGAIFLITQAWKRNWGKVSVSLESVTLSTRSTAVGGQVYKAEAGHRFCLGDLAKEKTQERELSLEPCNLGFPLKSPGSIPLHFSQNKSWRSRDCSSAPRANCPELPL